MPADLILLYPRQADIDVWRGTVRAANRALGEQGYTFGRFTERADDLLAEYWYVRPEDQGPVPDHLEAGRNNGGPG